MQKSVFFLQPVAAASCTLPCSLRLNFSRSLLIVRSVSETRSSASTSSSLFILTEENLFNKPAFVKADIRLKYQAICCSINQSVLCNIYGRCRLLNSILEKPHFLLVSSPVRHTFRRYFFALLWRIARLQTVYVSAFTVSAYPRQSYHIKFIAVTTRQLGKLMFSKRPSCLSSLFIDSKITVTVCVL